MKPIPDGIGDRGVTMTFQLRHGDPTPTADEPVRLSMKPPDASPGGVNGGWWPRSRDTTVELPELVSALTGPFGVISLIALGSDAWAPGPHRLAVDDRVIAISRFHRQNAHTIMILGKDRSQTTLLVIPPEAPHDVAEAILRMASDRRNTASPTQILADGWLANPRPRIVQDDVNPDR